MRRSIELGRAVLSTSTANLELWLKTLITISPKQQYTELEQRDANSILSLLSSGDVWVGRGNGLYMDLDITLRGQPLAYEQLQQLYEAMLEAPVWSQLHLQPSIPCDAAHEPGKLRIMINHIDQTSQRAAKQRHRVLANMSAADSRPPEGVPFFSLDSIGFSMDVFEVIPKRTIPTAKRLKPSPSSNQQSQLEAQGSRDLNDVGHEPPDPLLLDPDRTRTSHLTSTLKRSRPRVSPTVRTVASPSSLQSETLLVPQPTSQVCETQDTHLSFTGVESTSMQTLVDGALRLSVLSSINSKMLPGIKVKANTFGPGLANIVPTLWKPGYLLSLSQRSSLLPTISRSLCRPEGTAWGTSISMKQKLSALAAQLPILQPPVHLQDQEPANALDKSRLLSSIAPCLWLHLQKHVPCKQAASLQSFITTGVKSKYQSDSILEETWQKTRHNCKSTPDSAGLDRDGASNVGQSPEACSAATATCDGALLESHLSRAMATPESILEADDDELLLGAQSFEGADLLASRSTDHA